MLNGFPTSPERMACFYFLSTQEDKIHQPVFGPTPFEIPIKSKKRRFSSSSLKAKSVAASSLICKK